MWWWTSIGFIPSKLEVIFAQFQEPKAFNQTGMTGSFNSTSKPLFVTELKASGFALYFYWMCLSMCKEGHKATLPFEYQPLVPAEPRLTQSFAFTLFFQNLTPLFLLFRPNVVSAPYSAFFLPNIRKSYSFPQKRSPRSPRSLMCEVLPLKSHNPGTSAVQTTFCQG